MKNPYKILGVSENASDDEVKSAYRKLAKQFHPDVNPSKDAESKFKEITHAYDTIINKKHVQESQQPDMNEFFREAFRAQDELFRRARNAFNFLHSLPPNVEMLIQIGFLEACFGCEKKIEFRVKDKCESCEKEKKHKPCVVCGGTGHQSIRNGFLNITTICSACNGTGRIVECSECGGNEYIEKTKVVQIKIPAGIDTGNILRVQGEGNWDFKNERFGDILIRIEIEKHSNFQRNARDIYSKQKVNYYDCILGSEIDVHTIHGIIKFKIPECCQNNTTLKIDGFGIKNQGNHYLTIEVSIPNKLNKKEKKILNNIKKNASQSI
jgi:molecular chaperone DnaJ